MGTKKESKRDLFAKRIIQQRTFIALSSNEDGAPGKVDYVSVDPGISVAVEVTSHTNQERSNLVNGGDDFTGIIPVEGLAHNWLVQTRDYPRIKALKNLVVPELHALNVHGITEYYKHHHEWWMSRVPTLAKSIAAFNSANVEYLKRDVLASTNAIELAEIQILPTINWMYGGPDSALEIIEKTTLIKEDNRKKLRDSRMQHRHLFIVMDSNTDRDVLDAFNTKLQQLPSRNPILPEEITHLWLVDIQTEIGWYFEPMQGWQLLE